MLTCSCSDDYDVADVFQQTMRVARKEHQCCECFGVIRCGERYEYITMLIFSHRSTHRTCGVCAAIAKTMQSCGREPGQLWENIHEENCIGDYYDGNDGFCICPETRRAR